MKKERKSMKDKGFRIFYSKLNCMPYSPFFENLLKSCQVDLLHHEPFLTSFKASLSASLFYNNTAL